MLHIDLTGTAAIVTGGANGIGAACVRGLQAAGATVTAVDVSDLTESPADHRIAGDVTHQDTRERALKSLLDSQLDRWMLVNNAALQIDKRLEDTSAAELDRLWAVNVAAVVDLTKSFAAAAPAGSNVVNMGSVLGVTGDPALAGYTITKGAIANFTRTAALAFAPKVRVNAVLPGAIRTPLTTRAWDGTNDPENAERRMTSIYPLRRIGEPDDVAGLVAFLGSSLATFITGAQLPVDGGLLAANAEWGLEQL